jgi:hypothetical protein
MIVEFSKHTVLPRHCHATSLFLNCALASGCRGTTCPRRISCVPHRHHMHRSRGNGRITLHTHNTSGCIPQGSSWKAAGCHQAATSSACFAVVTGGGVLVSGPAAALGTQIVASLNTSLDFPNNLLDRHLATALWQRRWRCHPFWCLLQGDCLLL